jgi:LacI family transcriptional regulator
MSIMRPTVRDVAKAAGVAPTTVSRVVNNRGYVSDETRQRVQAAIEHLGYIPNSVSRSLRLQRTNVVALIVSDITNPFWTTITRGVEDAMQESGLSLILGNTDEQPGKLDNYLNIMMRQQVDGVLVAPTHDNTQAIQRVKDGGTPIVLIDRFAQGVAADVVLSDSVRGGYLLTEHLIRLGHRRIVMLSGPYGASTSQQRREGYRQALAAYGIPLNSDYILLGDHNREHGFATTLHIFQTFQETPTALFAMNSQIAAGVIAALSSLGLRVPEDVSVVAFDDLPYGIQPDPFLTVIDQKPYELGYQAASLLLDFIKGRQQPKNEQIILPVELIIRKSCRAIGNKHPAID